MNVLSVDDIATIVRTLPDGLTSHGACVELARAIEAEVIERLTHWQPAQSIPRDGSVFLGACFELASPKYSIYSITQYKDARKSFSPPSEIVTEWRFNGLSNLTHWVAIPPRPSLLKE